MKNMLEYNHAVKKSADARNISTPPVVCRKLLIERPIVFLVYTYFSIVLSVCQVLTDNFYRIAIYIQGYAGALLHLYTLFSL